MDSLAVNYTEKATKDDGSCKYDSTGASVERISYGADERQHYDFYLPANHNENTKTVILIHGGAWVLGPLAADSVLVFGEIGNDLTHTLLAQGYAVALLKYRLACYTDDAAILSGDPYFYLSPMLADIDAAILTLKTNAPSKRYSPNHFALLGESAGAHLALMYALRSTDSDIRTVISFYAPTQFDDATFKTNCNSTPYNAITLNSIFALNDYNAGCTMNTTGSMNIFWGLNSFAGVELETGATQPAFTDTLSPAYANNIQNNLPIFLMHGMTDDLVPNNHADFLMTELNAKFGTSPAPLANFTGQHKLKKYNNCGHGWSGGSCNKAQIRNDVVAWLSAHF